MTLTNIEGFRLSPQQRRLWQLLRASASPAPYRVQRLALVRGPLAASRVVDALGAAVARHEILRTTFRELPGMSFPLQVVCETAALPLSEHDLSGADERTRARRLAELYADEGRADFDLARGPVGRAALVKLGRDEHALILTLSALCADPATLASLVEEICAEAAGQDIDGDEEAMQYADVAEVFNELLESEETAAGRRYWRERVEAAGPALELPWRDGGARADEGFAPDSFALELSPAEWSAVGDAAGRLGVTPAAFLLAGWQVLLWRLTSRDGVVVGVRYGGRNYEGLERAPGLFARDLPLLGRPRAGVTFGEFAREVAAEAREAEQWQDYFSPSDEAGAHGREEFFLAAGFDFDESPEGFAAGGLEVRTGRATACLERFELRLSCAERGGGLRAEFHFDPARYGREAVELCARRFRVLLLGAAREPAAALGEAEVLDAAERRRLLAELNDTARDYGRPRLLHRLFEEQAARTPEAPALAYRESLLTYAELDARAGRLARALRQNGVGPEVVVGVLLERSVEMVVALLGVLKAGGAYLPLDPALPSERLAFMLEDARAPVVLTRPELRGAVPEGGALVVTLGEGGKVSAGEGDKAAEVNERDAAAPSPDNLAYVIYTSGSTGQPKGVQVPHRAICNRLLWMDAAHPLDASDRVLQKTPFSFDASIWELISPLMAGARLVLAEPGGHRDGAYLVRAVVEHGITVLQLVPSMLRVFLATEGAERCRSLRRVFCGGEELTEDLRGLFYARLGAELHNLYGPTESAIDASTWACPREGRGGVVPIGRALPNIRLYVADGRLRLTPLGAAGELLIGGESLARGYLNRPGLTAERFVPDPFSNEPGARLYRTGDLVRFLPDGELEFLGRADQQVKLRGYRIELGEIEAALRRHAGVHEAVVVARADAAGDRRLTAYVIGAGAGLAPPAAELRQHLRAALPEYMIPAAFVALEELPRTSTGKVDRKALPEPNGSGAAAEYVAPRTPVEEVVAGVWAELLSAERVGAEDNFFELGGHSLLATQVVSRLREALGVEVELRKIFEAPTVSALAAHLDVLMKAGVGVELAPLRPAARGGALPLSFAQQRLWFLDQMEPGSPFYNIPGAARLSGTLDVAALRRTVAEVVRRHESLRAVFVSVDGRPRQHVLPVLEVPLPVIDLGALPASAREAEALRLAREETRLPFDLARGPLMRTTLLRLGPEEHVLFFTMHHIVSDIWSRGVLIREVRALYTAFTQGLGSPLAELPLQYADFAAWQREWLQGEALEAELSYWRRQLAGAPAVLDLPTDRPRPPVQSYTGAMESVVFPAALAERLRGLSRESGATMFMTTLAAFFALLARYTGREDFLVGSPVANRDRRETEGLIGFFTNTLVLRADLAGNPTFRELVGRVRDVALGAYAHRDLPFEYLVEELQPDRGLSHSPLFQVMFVHQVAPEQDLELPGLAVGPFGVASGTAKFDLTLFVVEAGGKLGTMLEYNTDLFDAATARRLLRHWQAVLEAAVEDPHGRVLDLPLLTDEERGLLLREWNDTARVYGPRRLVTELFDAQARRTPDVPAVVFGETSWTYAELDARANQLARRLQALGVGPEVPVAICLERSPEMIMAMLAVIKSGGAYLPLDATYPRDRLDFMLADARPRVLLTQRALRDALPEFGGRTLLLDEEWEEVARLPAARPASAATPDNLAYLIYTSGSTGKPKAIAMRHAPLFNLIAWQLGHTSLGVGARTLQFASLSFDVSNHESFSTWAAGGTLVLLPEAVRRDMTSLLHYVAEQRINRIFVPFVVLQQLAEMAEGERLLPEALREVNTAGEQLHVTPALVNLFGRLPGAVLYNQYGPSECHVVSALTLDGDPAGWPALPPIGTPIANTQIYILDRALNPTPLGVPGELLIGGESLARGYHGRPALTAGQFIPDPFSGEPGARLYRTGDLARWTAAGQLEFLGRIDHQVKIRGFRVELGEVEAALRRHAQVGDCVVVARGEGAGEKRLVAYVVGVEGAGAPPAAELRQYLRAALPEYMVPAAFVALAELPLNTNGKVDRKALPEPGREAREVATEYVAPRTPVEEVVAGVWAELLGAERVGAEDNFFELGGHSLLATQVVSRLREALGVEIPLRRIFESPTVAGLSASIEQARRSERGLEAPPIERVRRDGPLPVSFIQERLWALARLEGRPSFYNLEVRLSGTLDARALGLALGEIVRRHEALRTTFVEEGEEVRQLVNPPRPVPLPLVDLSALPPPRRAAEVGELAAGQGRESFDLRRSQMLRCTLVRLAAEQHSLLVTIPHIACDHWSVNLLAREVPALYEAFLRGQPSPLPELPVQYADYAAWERGWMSGEVYERELGYWRGRLGDCEVLRLPTDRPRPPVKTYRGLHEQVYLPEALARAVDEISLRERCTRFMTLLAAYKAMLHGLTGQEAVTVGTAIAARSRASTEQVIGSFSTPLAIRTEPSPRLTFRELMRQVRESALDAYTHQDFPFDRLAVELTPDHDPSYSPVVQVGFVLHHAPAEAAELPGLRVEVVPVEAGRANFDLTLSLHHTPHGIFGSLGYNTDLFDEATARRLVGLYQSILEVVTSDPDVRLGDVPRLAREPEAEAAGAAAPAA